MDKNLFRIPVADIYVFTYAPGAKQYKNKEKNNIVSEKYIIFSNKLLLAENINKPPDNAINNIIITEYPIYFGHA